MQEPRPFASLSSNLLARKGQARPAMRPQGYTQPEMLEDLGWNDMGLQPSPTPAVVEAGPDSVQHAPPPVVRQQAAIAEELNIPVEALAEVEAKVPALPATEPVPASEPVAPAKPAPRKQAVAAAPRAMPGNKTKAAFTLRLDPDRHLKLRLACAIGHRSAQMLVLDALDSFLAGMPELDKMAAQARHR